MWHASFSFYGPIAQLGERSVRIREVEGSNPFRSTTRKRLGACAASSLFLFQIGVRNGKYSRYGKTPCVF